MAQAWPPEITVPFLTGGFEWVAVMEVMVILGLLGLIVLAGALWMAMTEVRTQPRPARRDLWLMMLAAVLVTFAFLWPPNFFYASFAATAALVPGLAAYLAADHPFTVGLVPVVLASALPSGRLFGWWDQCHCPLAFLVGDPPGKVVLWFVPTLSIAMLGFVAGLGARRLFSARRTPNHNAA